MTDKVIFKDEITCQHCGNRNSIRIVKRIDVPATPAQTTIHVFVDKSTQTTLKGKDK